MSAAANQSSPIAPEFLGRARAARTRLSVGADAIGSKMRKIGADAFALLKRKQSKGLSAANLEDIEAQWRTVPLTGCVNQSILRTNRRLEIVHIRASAATLFSPELWQDNKDPALCLVENRVMISKHRATTEAVTTAAIGMHALGRYMQRSFDTSDTALMLALKQIAVAAPSLLSTVPQPVTIETNNGGCWRGSLAEITDDHGKTRPALNIRTFW